MYIEVKNLCKTFKISKRSSGLANAFKSFFKKNYSYVKAVENVSFTIKKGEIVGYIGPNGAGKSTTIKMLTGILKPDGGEILVGGMNPFSNRKKYVAKIGVVFGQKTQLWWDIAVEESFDLLKEIYKIDDESYQKTKNELISLLNLKEIIKTPVRQLSLGERMRCEIAASLLHSPDILFLDEPTIGLDAVSKENIRKFIKKINKVHKVTIILTSHDMTDIESLTKRIIVIGHGHKVYDGTLDNIKQKYINEKIVEIIHNRLEKPFKMRNIKVLKSEKNRIVLNVNASIGVSKVIKYLSDICEITDVNILNDNLDQIIIKMYADYGL